MITTRRRWMLGLILTTLLSGCWDRREIEERSNALASGIDLCEPKQGCDIIMTRQIPIPGRIPLGSAAEGTSAGGGQDTVFVQSSPGVDVQDSFHKAQAGLNRKLTFGHTRIMVLSEAYARRGIANYVDYQRRMPEVRRLMWIAVTDGRAAEVLRARPALEQVPALFLNDLMDDAVKSGRTPKVFFGEFLTRLSNKGEETIAPIIQMAGPDRPRLNGLAVFRDYQMVGRLTQEETTTYMEVKGQPRGFERLEVDLGDGKRALLLVFGRRAHHRPSAVGGKIESHVSIELETELGEASPGLHPSDPAVIRAIERKASDVIKGRAEALVQKLQQEYHADILGLGEQVRALMPATWKSIKDWPTTFSESRFTFSVQVRVRRGGMSTE